MSSINERVRRMFGDRFGTDLTIKWSNETQLKPDAAKEWQTTFVYSRTRRQVSFPIFNNENQLKAIAIASPVNNDDAVRFQEMSQFLQLTVKETLVAKERLDLVIKSEDAFSTTHNEKTNVIRWPYKKKSKPIPKAKVSRTKTASDDENSLKAESCDFRPLWLFGTEAQSNLKVAYAAHEWIRNWAFINVKEIPDLFWQRSDSWTSYAQMTIMIPEVDTLTAEQWETLSINVNAIANTKGPKPLLILTSTAEPETLNKKISDVFKVYKTNRDVTPKAQAHFLLFQKHERKSWIYSCSRTKGLYFLPFGTTSDLLH